MTQLPEYATGYLEGNIHDFLLGMGSPAGGMTYALITCLDSCAEPATLISTSKHLLALKPKITLIGSGLLVPTKLLLAAEPEQRLFFGFDELWFLSKRRISPKPSGFNLVGPNRIDDTLLLTHGAWLKQSGCALALGDGVGMNFCVRATGAAKLLLDSLRDPMHA